MGIIFMKLSIIPTDLLLFVSILMIQETLRKCSEKEVKTKSHIGRKKNLKRWLSL